MAFHLIRYAAEGDVKKIEKWIDLGVHINASNIRKETALFIASVNGHVKCVEFLLSRGADPNRSVLLTFFVVVYAFSNVLITHEENSKDSSHTLTRRRT
jgi:ankyrin repeat protein